MVINDGENGDVRVGGVSDEKKETKGVQQKKSKVPKKGPAAAAAKRAAKEKGNNLCHFNVPQPIGIFCQKTVSKIQ